MTYAPLMRTHYWEKRNLADLSLEKAICDEFAEYWLEGNSYCGMASISIFEKLPAEIKG